MTIPTLLLPSITLLLYRTTSTNQPYLLNLTLLPLLLTLYCTTTTSVPTTVLHSTLPVHLSTSLSDTTTMAVTYLTTVTLAVLLYSTYYLGHDVRGISLLSSFSTGMYLLMVSDDLLSTLVGWEAIGILSVLLVSLYTARSTATRAALKACIYNRLGDLTLVLAVCLALTYSELRMGLLHYLCDTPTTTLLSTLLLLSAWCKSAQLGMHVWLLDAMEGPTPVSSLLHSATLVLAGTVLLVKAQPLWSSTLLPQVLQQLGTLTALYASSTALLAVDIKRLVALSTATHVGLMMIGIGVLGDSTNHALTHSSMKACLFMVLGYVLHTVVNQDTRLSVRTNSSNSSLSTTNTVSMSLTLQ